MKRLRSFRAALLAALLACAMSALLGCARAEGAHGGPDGMAGRRAKQPYAALLAVYGEIDMEDAEYDHFGTLDALAALEEDRDNVGLIVLLDTPGGSVYEMDELYHALMSYREHTGRPVFAYMERECCSAGVYVAMAAQRIAAARMTLTGSVGVYMDETTDAQLLEKLGMKRETVVTGENKLTAPDGLTEEQRAILQGLVDESFGYFKDAIAAARGADVAQNETLLDGRLLTATQARELGLIDDILYYEEAIDLFYELGGFGDAELLDVTPEWDDPDDAQETDGSAGDALLDFLYDLGGAA